jgi:hypothetical protein
VNLSGILKQIEEFYTAEVANDLTMLIVHGSEPIECDSVKADRSVEDEGWVA